ncbi:DNA repair protein, Rad18 [Cordyceps fumosorosea ARSEF 2679]|uniref:Postreplication repair E3 ubiquitin-protein ligase RAD18 n=1 Tax=Cordyceps fumosorosea (strain ARSEF 2679) TaxID=1081104 RepID=A0A167NVH6_CORFA|nr:DNA repair protein, Rad18 [Cordyceps fumosorosea ARSEF 2679]OAA55989.1 DNA repair protein, Rad18 [Cordyceps fumosorosea ARSEF 2679]
MPIEDVADSTDWLSTPLSRLSAVESSLRCEVCKDFYKTPMITSCAHTFCSICIRRALSSDSKCPLCRATDQELKLRSNWSMEQTVAAFSEAREEALKFARSASVEKKKSSPKRKADGGAEISQPEARSKRLRSSVRLSSRAEVTPPAPSIDVVEDLEDEDFEPENDDGLVPCPMCQRRMKEWQVFSHLESCPGPGAAEASPQRPKSSSSPTTAQQTLPAGQMARRQQSTLERLPSLSYSIFKEQALRRKLAEIGISNQGPRPLLERRHREWLTIWNANCDAARPRRRAELLRDLDVWERTQGGKSGAASAQMGRVAVRDKEFDGAAWAARHGDSFKDLIADARRTRLAAQKKADDAAAAEDEEEAAEKQGGARAAHASNLDEIPASPVQGAGDAATATINGEAEEWAAPISSQANGVMQEPYL